MHTYIETYEDFVLSIVFGGLLSFVLINFGSKKTVISEAVAGFFNGISNEQDDDKSVKPEEEETVYINGQNFIKKTKSIQKVLGISEDQIKEAVEETNNELKQGIQINVPEDSFSWASVMDGFVILFVVAAIFQSINVMTKGDFARVMAGLFPKEADSMKLATDRFNNFVKIISSHVQTVSSHFEL